MSGRLEWHVAPHGRVQGDGSASDPLPDLATAVVRSRAHAGRPRRIVVGNGLWHEQQIELTAEDSGLTIEAAKGAAPTLSGGRPVTGWRWEGERLVAFLPEVAAGRWDFRHLTVNGRLRPRARYPREGRLVHQTVFDVPWLSASEGGWKRWPTDQELTTLICAPDDWGPWLRPGVAEITVFHQWDESLVGVARVDPRRREVIFSNPAGSPPGAFGRQEYVVWNVPEGMHEPGQWYLDRPAGKLVYWPLPGEEPEGLQAVAPVHDRILTLSGEKDRPLAGVTLRGLGFTATTTPPIAGSFGALLYDGAVTARFVQDCAFEGLRIGQVGGQGLKVRHGQGITIDRCEVQETGAGGIVSRMHDARLTRCHVHHVGLTYPSALALRAEGDRIHVAHNHVHDTTYTAFAGGRGEDCVIEHNRFERVMQVLHDGAAVYVIAARRFVIRHNVTRSAPGGMAHAYYLDELSEDSRVEDNLAVDVSWPLQNHMSRRCVLRGNVCVHEQDLRVGLARCHEFVMEGNILSAGGAIRMSAPPDGFTRLAGNVLHSGAGVVEVERLEPEGYKVTEVETLAPDDGNRFDAPRFVNPAAEDYRLASDAGCEECQLAAAGVGG